MGILEKRAKELINIIIKNEELMKVIDTIMEMNIPNCYVGAGAIVQTVWNYLMGNSLIYGIDDVDIVYFDSEDLSEEKENELQSQIKLRLKNLSLHIDVVNEARVHQWYKEKFGYNIKPYNSVEEAISTWPTTATSLGMRKLNKQQWEIYTPFGLDDIFNMRIVANNRQITEIIYNNKVEKWTKKWSQLNVVEWNDRAVKINNNKSYIITLR